MGGGLDASMPEGACAAEFGCRVTEHAVGGGAMHAKALGGRIEVHVFGEKGGERFDGAP